VFRLLIGEAIVCFVKLVVQGRSQFWEKKSPRVRVAQFALQMELSTIVLISAGITISVLSLVALAIQIYEERNLRRALHPTGSGAVVGPPIDREAIL